MKKFVFIILMGMAVASCAKKMTPATAETPAGNTGGVTATADNDKASNSGSNTVAAGTATIAVPASAEGSKSSGEVKDPSPEVAGMQTYNAKCGRCHGLKVVSDYSADRWITVMQVMAPKAKLSDLEKENVLAYVKANAKR
ncbi:MAG: hypothetical protein IPP48_04860 [Chitinophagaceae bacterium]|nr:hypothetical protein [Chitinophagaceae bacterium]